MTVDYQKVLFASDLSALSRRAFSHAADIAARHRADMIFVHVLEGSSVPVLVVCEADPSGTGV